MDQLRDIQLIICLQRVLCIERWHYRSEMNNSLRYAYLHKHQNCCAAAIRILLLTLQHIDSRKVGCTFSHTRCTFTYVSISHTFIMTTPACSFAVKPPIRETFDVYRVSQTTMPRLVSRYLCGQIKHDVYTIPLRLTYKSSVSSCVYGLENVL